MLSRVDELVSLVIFNRIILHALLCAALGITDTTIIRRVPTFNSNPANRALYTIFLSYSTLPYTVGMARNVSSQVI